MKLPKPKKPNLAKLKKFNGCYPIWPNKYLIKHKRPPLPHELVNAWVRKLDLPAPKEVKECK